MVSCWSLPKLPGKDEAAGAAIVLDMRTTKMASW